MKDNEEQVQFKGDFKHLRAIVEREIVLRCAKHVFKSYLRNQLEYSQLHVSHCVTHLLNLLLCPQPFLHTLNNGTVKFIDETIQSQFESYPDIVSSHTVEKPVQQVKETEKPAVQTEQTELSKK